MQDVPEHSSEPRTRIRSTIAFPYGSLVEAEEVANILHDQFGYTCESDQLAASMGTTPNHGTFRVRIATTRIFGAIEVGRGSISLTDLGARLADATEVDQARIEAFLHVPLYAGLYEMFRGQRLPANKGLEHQIVQLGVSPKQAASARIAFQRSAEHAGFFAHGPERLVRPAVSMAPTVASAPSDEVQIARKDDLRDASEPANDLQGLHPLLVGLIRTIPREGESFSPKRQQQWLEAAKVNFALIFGADDDNPPTARQNLDEVGRDFSE